MQANQPKLKKDPTLEDNSQEFWIEDELFWICNPCFFHSKHAPAPLLVGKKGSFGYVGKAGKASDVTTSKTRHCETNLHRHCIQEYKEQVEKKTLTDNRNEIAGKKIIRNAIFCLKRGLGSQDFLLLNLKDFLAEKDLGSKSYNVANKNDSKAQFFRLRTVIFDSLTAKTIKFFSKN